MGCAHDGRCRLDHLSGEPPMEQLVPIFQIDGQRVDGHRPLPTVRRGRSHSAPELDRGYEVLFDAPDGALAVFVLFEHPDLVHEGRLLHLGDVRDYEDLTEGPLEAFEGKEHVVATRGVQAAEYLVEDEEAQSPAAAGGDELGEGNSGG